jgi:hypothetical protein
MLCRPSKESPTAAKTSITAVRVYLYYILFLDVEDSNRSNWWMTALETLVFVGLAGFQVYYIMNMLENKRLLL